MLQWPFRGFRKYKGGSLRGEGYFIFTYNFPHALHYPLSSHRSYFWLSSSLLFYSYFSNLNSATGSWIAEYQCRNLLICFTVCNELLHDIENAQTYIWFHELQTHKHPQTTGVTWHSSLILPPRSTCSFLAFWAETSLCLSSLSPDIFPFRYFHRKTKHVSFACKTTNTCVLRWWKQRNNKKADKTRSTPKIQIQIAQKSFCIDFWFSYTTSILNAREYLNGFFSNSAIFSQISHQWTFIFIPERFHTLPEHASHVPARTPLVFHPSSGGGGARRRGLLLWMAKIKI